MVIPFPEPSRRQSYILRREYVARKPEGKRWYAVQTSWVVGDRVVRHEEVVFAYEPDAIGMAYRRFTPPVSSHRISIVETVGP